MREAVEARLPAYIHLLTHLVAVRGVSADGLRTPALQQSAALCARLLSMAGFPRVEILDVDGAGPAVWAERPGPPDSPTVLLYAHHDVQPVGDLDRWTSSPWEAEVREGRLYGRGTADDKGGLVVHLAALEHLGDAPLTLRVLVEGDEEVGSPGVDTLLATHADRLRADVVVLPDAVNSDVGVPSLTVALRGLVDLLITVRTLEAPLHSGLYGGAVPDALGVLVSLLASLTRPDGSLAVDGLLCQAPDPAVSPPDLDRWHPGALDGLEIPSDGADVLLRTVWSPSATVVGIDAPAVASSSASLTPEARARVVVRLAPEDDAQTATKVLIQHLANQPVRGAQVSVEVQSASPGLSVPSDSVLGRAALAALTEGFGVSAVPVGVGGSIPFTSAYTRHFGDVPLLVTAVQDPHTRAHSYDESLDLDALISAICL